MLDQSFNKIDHFSKTIREIFVELARNFNIDSDGEKWIIEKYSDEELNLLFESLYNDTNDEVEIKIDNEIFKFRYIKIGESIIIPCRAKNEFGGNLEDMKPNYCTREFCAKLRDFFAFNNGEQAQNRVLLIIDKSPVETQKASRNLTNFGQPLHPEKIIQKIIFREESQEIRDLLKTIVELWKKEIPFIGANEITIFSYFVGKIKESNEPKKKMGELLDSLGIFLKMQEVSKEGLKENISIKKNLEELDDPQKIPENEIKQIYREKFGEQLLEAYNEGKVEERFFYEDFKKNELKQQSKKGLKVLDTEIVSGGRLVEKSYDSDNATLKWVLATPINNKEIFVKMKINRPLTSDETIKIENSNDQVFLKENEIKHNQDNIEFPISFENGPRMEFFFTKVVLKKGRRRKPIYEMDLAIIKIPDEMDVYFEKRIALDTKKQAFSVSNENIAYLISETNESTMEKVFYWDGSSNIIKIDGPSKAIVNGIQGESEVINFKVTIKDEEITIPVCFEQADEQTEVFEANSVFEIFIEERRKAIRSGQEDWVEPQYYWEDWTLNVGNRKYEFADFSSLLSIENKILKNPDVLIWKYTGDENLTKNPLLDDLQNWEEMELKEYLEKRKEFFEILIKKEFDSVLKYFLSKDSEVLELAKEYINSYKNLCKKISKYGEHTTENYWYAIYTDLVEVPDKKQIWISPTHPLSVSFLIKFGEMVSNWLSYPAEKFTFGKNDLKRINVSDYIPLLKFKGEWYRALEGEFVAWNKLQLSETGKPKEGIESYVYKIISDKLNHFIEVHEVLFEPNREKTQIKINFVNPGNGRIIIKGLNEFFRSRKNETTPNIHLNLIGDGNFASDIDLAFASDQVPIELERFIELEELQFLKEKVSYSKKQNVDQIPYGHISFVINEFYSQIQGEEWINNYPTSIYAKGLVPKVTSKLFGSNDDNQNKTYVSTLWINETAFNGETSDLAFMAKTLQEQYNHINEILEENKVKTKRLYISRARLKSEIYNASRWVVHLDRELGAEVFSAELAEEYERPVIIDYSNQYNPQKDGYDVITTTSQLEAYLRKIEDLLNLSNPNQAKKATKILNFLSGRWALNLTKANDNTVSEKIANVIAFQYLKLIEKVFEKKTNEIVLVVSLDDFLRIDKGLGLSNKSGLIHELKERGSFSDDLLKITIHPPKDKKELKVDLRIIEVKYGSSDKNKGKNQVKKSYHLFKKYFGKTELTDKLFRAMDFSNLVMDGINKSLLFGFITKDQLERINFDREIYPLLTEGEFQLHLDSVYLGERFFGEVISVDTQGNNFFCEPGDVRVISIPQKFFIPLLEEDEGKLADLISEFSMIEENTEHGLFPELEDDEDENGENEETEQDDVEDDSFGEGIVNTDDFDEEDQCVEIGDKDGIEEQPGQVKIKIGQQVGSNKEIYWDHSRNIENPLSNHNIIITGDPGKGKTQTVKSIIHQLRKHGLPVLVFDFKDDYVSTEFLKEEKIKKFDAMESGLPFNPLEPPVDPVEKNFIAMNHAIQIQGIITRIYGLGTQQSTQLRNAIIEAYQNKGIDVQIPTTPEKGISYPSFSDVYEILKKEERKHATLLGRIDLLFHLRLFRPESKTTINFDQLMNGSYNIRLTRLPVDEIKATVSELLIVAAHNYILTRNQPLRLTRAMILDEAHRISKSKPLLGLMREGRSFGMGMIIATQFPSDIIQDIYGCTDTKLFLGNDNFGHAETAASQIAGGGNRQEIRNLAEHIRNLSQFRGVMRNSHYQKVFVEIIPYFEINKGE